MTIYLLQFLLSVLIATKCQGAFYLSTGTSMWTETPKACTPATPKALSAVEYNPRAYIIGAVGTELPDNEDIWVGYYQVARVFEYIGCVEHRSFFTIAPTQYVTINGDPGHCFPGCGQSKVVGVTKTRCYCLGDTFNFTKPFGVECTDSCDQPRVACGKDRTRPEYSHLSIYRINPNDLFLVFDNIVTQSNIGSKKKDCLKMDPNNSKRLYWDNCLLAFKAMCSYGDRVDFIRCLGTSDYCKWIEAANACFRNGLFPTVYLNSKKVKSNNGSGFWTGLFKTHVVYKYNADFSEFRHEDKKQFGFLRKTSEADVKLMFTTDDSLRKTLCEQGKYTGRASTTHITQSFSVQTTGPPVTYTTLPNKESGADDGVGIFIAVGCSAAAVVLVGIIIITVVFVKRRRKMAFTESRQNERTNGPIENENNIPDLPNPNVSHDRNDHFILEPRDKGEKNTNETYDTATEDVAYDSAKECQNYEKVGPENVYNQLDTGKDRTYDHAFTRSGNNNGKDDTGMYDSSMEVKRHICNPGKSESIYNITEDTEEGQYHHLGVSSEQSKTDNLYGMQLIQASDKTFSEDHSTYNLTSSNDFKEKIKTDNTYSTLGTK